MAFACTIVLLVEWAPRNSCHCVYIPRGSYSYLFPFCKALPKGSNPGFFQITVFEMELGVCGGSLRAECFLQCSNSAVSIPTHLQSQSGGYGFLVQYPQAVEPNVGFDTLLLAENLYILSVVGYLLRGISLNYSASLSSLPILFWLFVCVCVYSCRFFYFLGHSHW